MRLAQTTFAAAVGVAFTFGLAGPASAQISNAMVMTDLNLRSGPDTAYPPVMVLPAGAPVVVYGCLDGFSWCDVAWGPNRGWVAGTYLTVMYQQQRVPFVQFAPRWNVPIITFSFGNYWDSYYRGRPWYADRGRWAGWDYGQRRWRGDEYRRGYDDKPKYDDTRKYDDKPRYDDKDRRRGRYDDKKNDKPPVKYDDKDKDKRRYDDKKNDKPARYDDKRKDGDKAKFDKPKNDKPKDDKPKADKKDDKKDDKK